MFSCRASALFAVGLAVWSCSKACVPGLTQACACPGGGTGAQACAESGQSWQPCACAPPASAAPPAPTLSQQIAEIAEAFTAFGNFVSVQQNAGGLPVNEDPSLDPRIGVLDRKMKNIFLFDDKDNAKLNPDGTLVQRYPNGWRDIKQFAIDHKIPFDGKNVSPVLQNEIDDALQRSSVLVKQNDEYIDRARAQLSKKMRQKQK